MTSTRKVISNRLHVPGRRLDPSGESLRYTLPQHYPTLLRYRCNTLRKPCRQQSLCSIPVEFLMQLGCFRQMLTNQFGGLDVCKYGLYLLLDCCQLLLSVHNILPQYLRFGLHHLRYNGSNRSWILIHLIRIVSRMVYGSRHFLIFKESTLHAKFSFNWRLHIVSLSGRWYRDNPRFKNNDELESWKFVEIELADLTRISNHNETEFCRDIA